MAQCSGSIWHMRALAIVSALIFAACAHGPTEGSDLVELERVHGPFTSAQASLMDFTWDGEVVADSATTVQEAIEAQVMFTVGALNAHGSVGRLERLSTSAVVTTPLADGSVSVRYHAVLPVAWNKNEPMPTSFPFTLPRRGTSLGLEAFVAAYSTTCSETSGGHTADVDSMFYYYRPELPTCRPASDDVVTASAKIAPSPDNTVGKYPEYQRVWQDDVLKAVIVFGKYEESATTNADPGIRGFDVFIQAAGAKLRALGGTVSTTPSSLPSSPGASLSEVTIQANLPYAKRAEIHVLLVSHLSKVDGAWDAHYASLTPDADLIVYNGHAGLGWNVRTLLDKGAWNPKQYLMLFINGCDTFAYADDRLRAKRALVNPDDVGGSKYLDMITNAMPSFADAYDSETVVLNALLDYTAPKTFATMLGAIDDFQVSVVVGEEDNTFLPGMQVGSQTPPSSEPDAGPNEPEPTPDAGTPGVMVPPASAVGTGATRTPGASGCGCSQGSSEGGAMQMALLVLAVVLTNRKHRRGPAQN
jgi:hypothetical protein